jgi:hypothetical protein
MPTFLRRGLASQLLSCIASMRSIVFFTLPSALPETISPALALEDLGRLLCRRPLASEKDLESYQRFAMEEKVDVISQLLDIPQAGQSFALGNGVEFENHANILSNNAEKVPTTHAATVSN